MKGNNITKNDKFLLAAGSWKDIDTDKLKTEIYKDRSISKKKCP